MSGTKIATLAREATKPAWIFVGAWRWLPGERRVVTGEDMARLYGIDRKLARAGATPLDFVPAIHPADRERVRSHVRDALRYGALIDVQHRLVERAGRRQSAWLQATCVATAGGRPSEYLGSVHRLAEAEDDDPLAAACDHLIAAGRLAKQADQPSLAILADMALMEAGMLLAARAGDTCVPLRRKLVVG